MGKTTDIKRRLSSHISEAKLNKGKRHVLNWINSLLKENLKPLIEIIEICDDLNWKEKEIYWIKFYRRKEKNLCNNCDGGLGGSGSKNFSKEEINRRRIKMSNIFSKFTLIQKKQIWKLIQKNYDLSEIKNIYPKYTRSIHFQVSTGRVWNEITKLKTPLKNNKLHSRSQFSKEDILKIRELGERQTNKQIAKIYSCNTSIIQRITNYKSYKNII
ncbi:MAG: hypothetical protein ACWIPJ_11345 [Polaribacter sp.]